MVQQVWTKMIAWSSVTTLQVRGYETYDIVPNPLTHLTRRYFQMQLREWEFCISITMSLKFVQAITWTNADPIHWRIYAALGEMS